MDNFFTRCISCGQTTSRRYAQKHDQQCKACAEDSVATSGPVLNHHGERIASRETQHARYIDYGPAAWDDR